MRIGTKLRQAAAFSVVALGVVSIAAAPTTASPITYTISGQGSGDLPTADFSGFDQFSGTVTITAVGDTAGIADAGGGVFKNYIAPGSATVSIPGIGIFTLTETIFAYVAHLSTPSAAAGIGSDESATLLATFNGGFAAYGLNTSISLSGSTFFTSFAPYLIDGPRVFFEFSEVGDTTFTATTEAVAGTPIPMTWPLSLLGFAGLGYFGRRRNKATTTTGA
jgi:hypothetical protein